MYVSYWIGVVFLLLLASTAPRCNRFSSPPVEEIVVQLGHLYFIYIYIVMVQGEDVQYQQRGNGSA